MSKSLIVRILPLLAIVTPLVTMAGNATELRQSQNILSVTLGEQYTGTLTPSQTNPQGEVCYQLAIKPDTRVTLKAKASGNGILKFAVYNKAKALQFFHNRSSSDGETSADTGFSFPTTGAGSQLCLTTTNPSAGQKYEFTVLGKTARGIRVRQPLPAQSTAPKAGASVAQGVTIPPPPTIEPLPLPSVGVPSAPVTPPVIPVVIPTPPTAPAKPALAPASTPYCYVGAWQINDLSPYWLPMIQNFTQAKITDPRMVGYAKIVLTKDGKALFESFDLVQKYTLKSKQTGEKIDNLEMTVAGRVTARFQESPNNSLTFSSQKYQRQTTKLSLGYGLDLSGDRLFPVFGDRLSSQVLSYKCVDNDTLIINLPLPVGKQSIPITLKRIN